MNEGIFGVLDARDIEFWHQAAQRGLPRFRFLRKCLTVEELDRRDWGLSSDEWQRLKQRIEPGDQIWPFRFHVRSYLGLREGYIV